MTKEQYVNMRNLKRFDLNLLYKFYIEKSKDKQIIDFNIFNQLFSIYAQTNSKDIIEFLDKQFNILILEDKNGNEVKVW